MGIKLLNPHVLVAADSPITKIGNVELPEMIQRKPTTGRVVTVGRFVFNNGIDFDLGIRVGDTVLYRAHDGETVEHNGTKYLLLTMQQVIGVLTPEELE